MPAQLILDALRNKNWPQTVIVSAIVSICTWKILLSLVYTRDRFEHEFRDVRSEAKVDRAEIVQLVKDSEDRSNKRFELIEAQIKRMWTVDMQVIKSGMVVARNTNIWVPDDYRIYEAIRQGKAPDAIRITSP